MFSNIIKMTFSYTQRALTPKNFSNMIQSSLNKRSLGEVMHNLYLYQNNVNVFDYDYYQKISYFLLDFQKKMTNHEIMTVLRLGLKHNIKNQMIWKHFEAELHQRLNSSIMPLIQKQQKQAQDKFNKIFEKLQSSSKDQFKILTDQFLETQNQQQQDRISPKLDKKYPQTKKQPQINTKQVSKKLKKDDISKYSYQMVEILIWYGCNNWRFINLVLEAQLFPTVMEKTPYTSIKFAELLVYACQINMRNYQQNKNQYTARSVKKIYKFQSFYFKQLQKILRQVIGQYSSQELKYLTDVIRSFPIKKREHRRNIVGLISNEWKSRGLQIEQSQKTKLQQILRKDQKLIQKFRKSIQKIEQIEQKKQQDNLDQQKKQIS